MNILAVLYWYCKQYKIMDIMFYLYKSSNIGTWKYNSEHRMTYYYNESMLEYLNRISRLNGIIKVFSYLKTIENIHIFYTERFKKAKSRWEYFINNNVFYVEGQMNEGDRISIVDNVNNKFDGIVIKTPTRLLDFVTIKLDGRHYLTELSLFDNKSITVNGVEIEPKFYIKRKGKVYGANKG